MEKYLVIFLVILLMYTVYQCWNLRTVTTEGFAEVPTNVDTNNSIKTLAQLAADLQSGGGLKVPGDLNVLGGSLVASSSGDQKSSKLSINADGIGYTFYVNPSKYTGGGGLDANHLQIFSYGGSAGISPIMHMWPGGVNVPGKFFAGGKDIVGEIMGLRNDLTNLRNELTTNRLKIGNATLEWKNDRLEISGAPVAIINNGLTVTQPGVNSGYITIKGPDGHSTLALATDNNPYFINGPTSTKKSGEPVANW